MKPISCPGVICEGCCESCGFSPWEQKRRLKEGHFQYSEVTHILYGPKDRPVHTVKKLCKGLVFKKGVANV